jgi:hypothetical protein
MIKIGLIGEDPNDTSSVKNLLQQKFNDKVTFTTMLKNTRGYQLDNSRVRYALEIEFKTKNPDFVLFVRDADAIITQKNLLKKKHEWYNTLLPFVKKKGMLLLNIYELEALIIADIETFNKVYSTSIKYGKDVMYQEDPKGFLMDKTRKNKKKYYESDCPELFKKLRFDTIHTNCKYFSEFILNFKKFTKL